MSDETAARPRRGRRTSRALPVEGTSHLEGSRKAYRHLAAQMEILGWTTTDEQFAEREHWLWEQLWSLARTRGLVEVLEPPLQAGEERR